MKDIQDAFSQIPGNQGGGPRDTGRAKGNGRGRGDGRGNGRCHYNQAQNQN